MSEAAVTGDDLQNGDQPGGVTSDDLEAIRQENLKLAEQIADAQRARAESEADHARNIEMGQLLTENVRLKAQLAQAEGVAEAAASTAESDALMGQIKDQLASAVKQADVTVGPVDTNSGYEEPEENLPSAQDKANAEAMEKSDEDPTDPGDGGSKVEPTQTVNDPSTSPTATTPGEAVTPPSTWGSSELQTPEVTDFLGSDDPTDSADSADDTDKE